MDPALAKGVSGHGVVSKAEEVLCQQGRQGQPPTPTPQSHHRNSVPGTWGIFIPWGHLWTEVCEDDTN